MITTNLESAVVVPWLLIQKKPPLPGVRNKLHSEPRRAKPNAKRILVIDDEVTIADSLTEILTSHGYDAVACYDGSAAIESARKQCPDLVIADVIMPRINGVDTVLAIRKLCPAARILLFSGQAGTADILREARANGHHFELLPKPIHPDQLLKRLSTTGSP
jgi:CheY-like chemotaxis protein